MVVHIWPRIGSMRHAIIVGSMIASTLVGGDALVRLAAAGEVSTNVTCVTAPPIPDTGTITCASDGNGGAICSGNIIHWQSPGYCMGEPGGFCMATTLPGYWLCGPRAQTTSRSGLSIALCCGLSLSTIGCVLSAIGTIFSIPTAQPWLIGLSVAALIASCGAALYQILYNDGCCFTDCVAGPGVPGGSCPGC